MKLLLLLVTILSISQVSGQLTNCAECASRELTLSEIEDLSLDEVNLLKNEIYARNGYQFESTRLNDYFSSQSWYTEKESNDKVVLSEIEKTNVSLLSKREKELEKQRRSLIAQLEQLKQLVLANDTASLRKNFGWTPEFSSESVQWLAPTFTLVQPSQIHFYKHLGVYKIGIDNGYQIIYHSITISGSHVMINQNYATHSEIIEDFDQFTDYRSEMEESYLGWQFEFENGKLQFVRELAAG